MTIALQQVNIGNYSNDGTGDDLRTAFQKVNNNFSSISTQINVSNGINLGTSIDTNYGTFFKDRNVDTLEFKSLTSIDKTIIITNNTNNVDLSMATMIMMDPNPMLGNNLDLNGFYVYDGDVQTSIFGINVPIMNGLLELILQSNQINVDLGSILSPTGTKVLGDGGTIIDVGYIIGTTYPNNNLNFGNIIN